MAVHCFIDGAARPNPGKGGIGVVIRGDRWDYTISAKCGDRVSNNQAEYRALCKALTELMRNQTTNIETIIHSDSLMLVEQMSGREKVDKGGVYVPDYLKAKELLRYFTNIKFQYIPREENDEANLLASRGTRNEY